MKGDSPPTVALVLWAPARVDLYIERVSAFAFAVVLILITSIGSSMTALRRTVPGWNRRRQETNIQLQQTCKNCMILLPKITRPTCQTASLL